MRHLIHLAFAALALAPIAAAAEGGSDGLNAERYLLEKTAKGYLRLDKSTGAISFCNERDSGWSCTMAADDRRAFEEELARLQTENAKLREKLTAGESGEPKVENFTPPKDVAPEAQGRKDEIPTDEDLDRVMNFAEKMMRRFFDMVDRLQKDYDGDRI